MNERFALDRSSGKLLGVCAGIARKTGIDVFAVRMVTVLATLFLLGPVMVLLYFVAAMVADNG